MQQFLFASILSLATAAFTCESQDVTDSWQCAAWVDGDGASSTFAPVSTELADVVDVSGFDSGDTYSVETNCLPSYSYTVSQADVDALISEVASNAPVEEVGTHVDWKGFRHDDEGPTTVGYDVPLVLVAGCPASELSAATRKFTTPLLLSVASDTYSD